MEGGPGYGTIGSVSNFRFMLGPLLRSRDLILMDARGTGSSEAIDCPMLQNGRGDYTAAVEACARALGPAANAYGSAAAADDMAAILNGLGVPMVDVYGDSYGTYLAQTFAIRHPGMTRSLALDGAFDDGFDPFARDAAAALRRSWGTLCRRSQNCPEILGDIEALARQLDRDPLVGTGVDGGGVSRRVHVDGADLAQLLYDATYVFTIYRDFPAAAAALERGDATPMLRLAAEDLVTLGGGGDPRSYSEGAYAAIACHDYPSIWDRSGGPDERRAQLADVVDALPDDAFSPLPATAWLRSPYEEQLVSGCLGWPAPPVDAPPTPTLGPHADLPVLVVNGEFDVTTPVANARGAARAWPNATFVQVDNEIHIAALYDYERCASVLVRRFIRTLRVGDTACATRTPTIHVVESFPITVAHAPQAESAGAGDRSTPADRRLAWAVAETVGDAFSRWWNVTGAGGVGLRGGSFEVRGPYLSEARPLVLTLRDARFVHDAAVDGRVVWTRHSGSLRGVLRVRTPRGRATLRLRASSTGPARPGMLSGSIAGRPVRVFVPPLWSP